MAEFKEISPNASAGEKLTNWFENRFPTAFQEYKKHMSEYYAPKNFNIWYVFGALSMLVLVIQIVTGIFLVMHYKPDAGLAFASVEYIMRDVPWGWLIRYMHSTGASAFFVVVYLHMFRGLMYGSYRKPRELVWLCDLSGLDGRSLHGLPVALGADVLLGGAGDRQPVLGDSICRPRSGLVDSR